MNTVSFKSVVLMVVLCVAATYAGTVKFDFGPIGGTDHDGDIITAEPGYIGVDPTMMYGGQDYMGLDYGITLYDGASTATGHEKSSWHTRSSQTSLALDYVYFNNKRSAFEIAVPNGDYTVTVAGGNPAWDENEIRLRMEGTVYGSTNVGPENNDNVYILDVCPIDRGDDGYLTWTLEDKEQHNGMTGYGIRTWGGNNTHGPEDSFMHMEIGYLQNQLVTVTDGMLSISGWEYDGTKINFMEITGEGIPDVPEPATMLLLGLGGLLIRRRK